VAVVGDENALSRSRHPQVWSSAMVIKRRRFKQTETLEVRLAKEAMRLREQAGSLPVGPLRDEIERKATQVEAAYDLTESLRLP
jgi:hypothetical protein